MPHLLSRAATLDSLWIWIVGGLVVLFVGLIFVLIPLLTFIAAIFERLHLRLLAPAPADRELKFPDAMRRLIDAARAGGFTPLGLYSDGDKGWKEGLVSLWLAPDHQALLWVQHRPARYRLVTALQDGTWVITSDVKGVLDLSGMHDEQMLPGASLFVMLQYHRERVTARGQWVLPFVPDAVVRGLLSHEHERVRRMVQRGLARYRSPAQDVWSYTLKGAAKVTMAYFRSLGEAKSQSDLAKSRASPSSAFPAD